ncbi:MAG: hypothetical protein WC942_09375 [Clostridia bacterium]|jgi:transcription elongation factor Elf1
MNKFSCPKCKNDIIRLVFGAVECKGKDFEFDSNNILTEKTIKFILGKSHPIIEIFCEGCGHSLSLENNSDVDDVYKLDEFDDWVEEKKNKKLKQSLEDAKQYFDFFKNLYNIDKYSKIRKDLIPFYFKEITICLKKIVDETFFSENLKYQHRLADNLQDMFSVIDTTKLDETKIKFIFDVLENFVEVFWELDREKNAKILDKILSNGLTWLPVTDKAQKIIKKG